MNNDSSHYCWKINISLHCVQFISYNPNNIKIYRLAPIFVNNIERALNNAPYRRVSRPCGNLMHHTSCCATFHTVASSCIATSIGPIVCNCIILVGLKYKNLLRFIFVLQILFRVKICECRVMTSGVKCVKGTGSYHQTFRPPCSVVTRV